MSSKVVIEQIGKRMVSEIQFAEDEAIGARRVTLRFLDRFSGNGLGRSAYRDSSPFRRLFWLLIFLVAMGHMVYLIVDAIKTYNSGAKATMIELKTDKELDFPSVTICAYSPLWKNLDDEPTLSKFKNLFELNEDLEGALDDILQPGDISHLTTVVFPLNDDTKQDMGQSNCIKPFVHLYPNDALSSSGPTGQVDGPTIATAQPPADGRVESSTPFGTSEVSWEENYDEDDLRKIFEADGIRVDSGDETKSSFYTLSDFREYINLADAISDIMKSIQHCSFSDVPCNQEYVSDIIRLRKYRISDFRIKNDSNHGQCLTYNYKGDKRVSRSGSSGGLHLRLLWNASNELVLLGPAKGFRVAVNHPKAEPDTLGEGFDVGLNMNSYVGVRKMSFERLPPDTDCAFDSYLQERFDKRIFKVSDENKYSKKGKAPIPACFREERHQWFLSAAQTVPQHALLLGLIAWLRDKKGKTPIKKDLMTETF
ncbi:unnamed protein product [Darwinula stevensoni]|uniref:Uncharacterized protein n=1 Tax=Darwinula stevensoni TaxID=69355 RepID=A0A7R9A9X7_9CRUS|nr:unnamed protein product [Darwinula stevensoni]CAG0897866.1 unnamed protein product [Darwinula stevensoni]